MEVKDQIVFVSVKNFEDFVNRNEVVVVIVNHVKSLLGCALEISRIKSEPLLKLTICELLSAFEIFLIYQAIHKFVEIQSFRIVSFDIALVKFTPDMGTSRRG